MLFVLNINQFLSYVGKHLYRDMEHKNMTDAQRIELLEKALIKYVEAYGFIKEARDYYMRLGQELAVITHFKQ
jgi:hypothetical protein